LDIWGYQDAFLQTTQLVNLRPKKYTAVISVEGTKVIRLEQADDRLIASPVKGDFVMIKNDKKGDRFWLTEPDVYYLVSLKDGTRSKLVETRGPAADFSFSPGGRYLVYYDPVKQGNYYSYDLQTGKLANISAGIFPWSLAFKNEYQSLGTAGNTYNRLNIGIAAWQGNDAYVLVYDNYDLWQLDLQGQKRPVNITNGYGTSHHIKFRIMVKKPDIPIFSDTTMFFMSAFNTINKYNGIYRKSLQQKGGPELLTMQPCTIYHEENLTLPPNAHELDYYSTMPMKAENVNIWMLKRQTATEAPNYFLTSDFKNYTALTNFQPQASYNWLTAELLTWKQSKNITTQGILYKPENFDPKKKYPVLITYYQQFSHRLYEYPMPGFTKNDINIPWFVSHGYLVFTPDIYFIEGKQGQSACDAIVSAAYELIKLSFVDPKKIGIQGHSYGGFMTNYIVTHTNLFAAAIESAGTSNWVSSSLQLGGLEKRASRLPSYENIIGSDLWKRPDLYLENSPVLKADKIITPLIICHSKTDTAVPWEQAVELFIAMRRLGKKVWMLQYDEGDHGAWEKNDYVDYTIRVTQFFDHYLKGTPPPIWMTQGIPARKKGIETGYELDTSGKQP
jgi:dipeptidyl aminopeptidase/acylaminoacyl peptidase